MLLLGGLFGGVMGMVPLMHGEVRRYPRLVWATVERLGLGFEQSTALGQMTALLFCLAYLFFCCLLFWRGAASLLVPGLRLTGSPPPFVPLALSFFLMPWLLLPAGLALALACRRSETK